VNTKEADGYVFSKEHGMSKHDSDLHGVQKDVIEPRDTGDGTEECGERMTRAGCWIGWRRLRL
jgi:hypothetical protein